MRKIHFTENKYFHVTGVGSGGQELFLDAEDRVKFLFLILYFQSPTKINNINYYVKSFLKKGRFTLGEMRVKNILKDRYLEVVSFAITSKDFQLLIKNLKDGVLSVYMQRILTSYSKYFNAKYKKTGHVFSGPFSAIQIKKDELTQTSRQIHKNYIETKAIENVTGYDWSSHYDFAKKNRWGELLMIS